MNNSDISPSELEDFSKVFTGRNRVKHLSLLDELEKKIKECGEEVIRFKGMVATAEDRLAMFQEMFQLASSLGERELNPAAHYAPPDWTVEEAPAAAARVEQKDLASGQVLILPAKKTPAKKPRQAEKAARPKSYNRIDSSRLPSEQDFAEWYEAVNREFGLYPPDRVAALYFRLGEDSDHRFHRLRHKAIEQGLITHQPSKAAGLEWNKAGITIADLNERFGIYDPYTPAVGRFREAMQKAGYTEGSRIVIS